MNNKVYIRADGNAQIGLGHLVRCIALAHMLKDDFNLHFVCKEVPESMVQDILLYGFGFTRIEEEGSFLALLESNDIVVLDHYDLDSNYQKSIKDKGCKLVCIDDLHNKVFFADLIINHSPGIVPEDYQAQTYTQFALGLEYSLLRPAFLKAAKQKRLIEKIETVFICFGGADLLNLTKKTLRIIIQSKKFKRIIVLTGPAYLHKLDSSKLLINNHVEYYQNVDEHQIIKLMLDSEMAIVPSSGILIETLACGLIPITCYYVKNQYDFHKEIVNLYQIQTVGKVDGFYDKKLSNLLEFKFPELNYQSRIKSKIGNSRSNILDIIKKI